MMKRWDDPDCGMRGPGGWRAWEPRCFKGDSTPATRDLFSETSGELAAKLQLQPDLLRAESLYRPEYTNLDLQDLESLLNGRPGGTRTENYTDYDVLRGPLGVPIYRPVQRSRTVTTDAQRGLLDLMENDLQPASDRMTAESQTRQRGADIADVANLGPQAAAAFRAANPEQASLLAKLNAQASEGLDAGAGLDPGMRREVQQSVRQGQSARGMGMGLSDLAQEGMFSGMAGDELRRRRQGFATQMVGLNQGTGVDPFMAILGRPAINLSQSGGLLGQGLGLNRSAGPQLFGSTVNANDVFDSNFNAQNAARISNANNEAAMTTGGLAAGGAALGVLAIAL